ncbi:hypothetical protein Mapa_008006 [Marchantia paleacea]|nr:hypothetical protein Mapa_008006 [Marchantia paleacea]
MLISRRLNRSRNPSDETAGFTAPSAVAVLTCWVHATGFSYPVTRIWALGSGLWSRVDLEFPKVLELFGVVVKCSAEQECPCHTDKSLSAETGRNSVQVLSVFQLKFIFRASAVQ